MLQVQITWEGRRTAHQKRMMGEQVTQALVKEGTTGALCARSRPILPTAG